VKAQPRYAVENLRELKAQEGIEARSDIKHLSVSTDRYLDQSSEGRASGSGWLGQPGCKESVAKGQERTVWREPFRLSIGESP
jgi:hypothetical protein